MVDLIMGLPLKPIESPNEKYPLVYKPFKNSYKNPEINNLKTESIKTDYNKLEKKIDYDNWNHQQKLKEPQYHLPKPFKDSYGGGGYALPTNNFTTYKNYKNKKAA